MAQLVIHGGTALSGTIRAGGSKNAALPMMAAAILAEGPVRLENVPRLADVRTLARVLRRLGMAVRWSDDSLYLDNVDPGQCRAPYRLSRQMRASFCVLGPLLARRGEAAVPLPGGCAIGDRPVDLHLKGLAALGADLRLECGYVIARARRLRGATVDLRGPRGPTVTGTANVLMAAVRARGESVLHGAACEPEIVDLGRFLQAMGADITGLGTPTIRVRGVDSLGGVDYRVIGDRIEAATLLLAAAITRGSATVTGIDPRHLSAVLEKLDSSGCRTTTTADSICVSASERPRPVDVVAEPYPGVPTDLQAQWTALMALADGRSTVEDRVFPGRFRHVGELQRMGAAIRCQGAVAEVTGRESLDAAAVTATDLRASAALVLAGLATQGRTVVSRAGQLNRGYERLDAKLRWLEASVQWLPDQRSGPRKFPFSAG